MFVCFVNKQAFSFQNAVTSDISILRSKTGHNSAKTSHPGQHPLDPTRLFTGIEQTQIKPLQDRSHPETAGIKRAMTISISLIYTVFPDDPCRTAQSIEAQCDKPKVI